MSIDDHPSAELTSDELQSSYLHSLTLIERLHRRLLDVIKDEFDRRGREDVTAVEALLLFNIGDAELTAGELRTRGYYLGSNVSRNLKSLVERAYVHTPDPVPTGGRSALALPTRAGRSSTSSGSCTSARPTRSRRSARSGRKT